MTKEEALSLEQTLRLALEALEDYQEHIHRKKTQSAITAIKAALSGEAQTRSVDKDEPVGLIESLKDAKPCCGQYETCWRACTPRGKFIGHRDAQRKPLTDEEIDKAWRSVDYTVPWDQHRIDIARAIEAAHGIIDPADLKGKHDA